MHPTVIEAAAKASHQSDLRNGYGDPADMLFSATWEGVSDRGKHAYRQQAESAITAALRELAPDIRAAVDALLGASDDYTFALFQDVTGEERFDRSQIPAFNAAIHARYDDLMALLGIPEDGA